MAKGANLKYIIKSVPSENTASLENLLNEMSAAGWDLYSMHEVETDDGFQYNCIFVTDSANEEKTTEEEEILNITTFKSQMERMLSSSLSPYETCKEIQIKIKEQRKKIAKAKSQLDSETENTQSKTRKHLNDEISSGLRELENLRQTLLKTISPEAMYNKIGQEKLSIHLSEELIDLVNPDSGPGLLAETVKIRQKLTKELGYIIPKIFFEDEDKLSPYEFSINVRGLEAITSFVYPKHLMFFEKDLNLDKKGGGKIQDTDVISGEKIIWIEEKKTKDFWQKGLNPTEVIARLLEFVAIKHVDDILDYSDINSYMDFIGEKNLFLVESVVPEFLTIAELRYLLVNLIRERVSVKDIVYIFEKINDFSDEVSKEDLLDKIRLTLSRFISKKMANDDGIIQSFELGEKTISGFFSKIDSDENIVRIDGEKIEKLVTKLIKKAKSFSIALDEIKIIVPLEIRHMAFMIFSQFLPEIKVIAKEEITNEYSIEILDEV